MNALRVTDWRVTAWVGACLVCCWVATAHANTLFRAFDLSVPGALPTRLIVTPSGEIWFVMTNANRIGRIQPDLEQITEYEIPTKQSTPTDLLVDGAGLIWFVEQDANQLGRMDPKTLEFKEYNIPTFNSLPARMVWDGAGAIWFTEHYSNQLGRFDMSSATFQEFPIPTPDSRPSGITMDREGRVWFVETNGNKLGCMTPKNGRFTFEEYALPTAFSVPRDLVADNQGLLWLAARSHQELLSFDVTKHTFETYRLPGGGVIEGLATDKSGRLLYSLGRTGKMGMFDTAKKVFTAFDSMSNNSRPFGVEVDAKGNIWYTDIAKNSLVKGNGESVSQLLNR